MNNKVIASNGAVKAGGDMIGNIITTGNKSTKWDTSRNKTTQERVVTLLVIALDNQDFDTLSAIAKDYIGKPEFSSVENLLHQIIDEEDTWDYEMVEGAIRVMTKKLGLNNG